MSGNVNVDCGDSIITGPFNLCWNGYDLGLNTGTVTLSQNNEYTEVRSNQSRSLIRKFKTQADYVVTATFATLDLSRLRLFLGQECQQLQGEILCINDSFTCSFGEEGALTICGPGPGCGCRSYHFPRATITPSTVELAMSLDDYQKVEIEFTILPSCPGGDLFCISDVCDTIAIDGMTEPSLCVPGSEIFCPPTSLGVNVGPLVAGATFSGSVLPQVTAGSDSNLTFEIVAQEGNPDCGTVTIDAATGDFTIQP